ncbi:hypothetical protein B0H10DRAFT_2184884 [Mycena sp. CBHHK59/15]|nr:hypothetical protein B0H10DRAFT_2184884 [Mycena sp. CBHHK59/15]
MMFASGQTGGLVDSSAASSSLGIRITPMATLDTCGALSGALPPHVQAEAAARRSTRAWSRPAPAVDLKTAIRSLIILLRDLATGPSVGAAWNWKRECKQRDDIANRRRSRRARMSFQLWHGRLTGLGLGTWNGAAAVTTHALYAGVGVLAAMQPLHGLAGIEAFTRSLSDSANASGSGCGIVPERALRAFILSFRRDALRLMWPFVIIKVGSSVVVDDDISSFVEAIDAMQQQTLRGTSTSDAPGTPIAGGTIRTSKACGECAGSSTRRPWWTSLHVDRRGNALAGARGGDEMHNPLCPPPRGGKMRGSSTALPRAHAITKRFDAPWTTGASPMGTIECGAQRDGFRAQPRFSARHTH